MTRHVKVKNRKIRYQLRRSRRARTMRLDAYYDGRVVLTMPWYLDLASGRKFIQERAAWILEQFRNFKNFEGGIFFRHDQEAYLQHREEARNLIHRRLEFYRKLYRVSYREVRVKNHKSMWGSCSRKGNLNFNYKLLFLPASVRDYIIVHEICHLKELNHSGRFWKLVAKTFPNYRSIERQLKERY